jgi:hypothetical protein
MTMSGSDLVGRDVRAIAVRLGVDPEQLLESLRRHPSSRGRTITGASDESTTELPL